jgi:Ca-activated chloride channel homolog
MMEFLQERFAPGPVFGWLCVVFLVATPVVWFAWRRHFSRPTVRFSTLDPVDAVGKSWALRTRFVPPLLRTVAIVALVIALARPQAGGEYRSTREGIAIQLVLDLSGSMARQDFVVNGQPVRRLDAVKQVMGDFIVGEGKPGGRENDLIGLTTFAMYADTVCPLTLDHGSVLDLLDDAEIPGWVNGRQVREDEEAGYTALGEAVVLASDDLRRAGEQAVAGVPGVEAAKSRVMILLTDGEDNPPPTPWAPAPKPLEAAKVAATLGIKMYTIGAVGYAAPTSGQQGLRFFFRQRDEVDEALLKEMARVTGGLYFRATDTEALRKVYEEINKLETRRTGERIYQDDTRAAQWAMFIGLALLATEWLLVNTRYRRMP